MKPPEQFGRKGGQPAGGDPLEALRQNTDEALKSLIENIDVVRQAQELGHGTPEDLERLRQLEKSLNERLVELKLSRVTLG